MILVYLCGVVLVFLGFCALAKSAKAEGYRADATAWQVAGILSVGWPICALAGMAISPFLCAREVWRTFK